MAKRQKRKISKAESDKLYNKATWQTLLVDAIVTTVSAATLGGLFVLASPVVGISVGIVTFIVAAAYFTTHFDEHVNDIHDDLIHEARLQPAPTNQGISISHEKISVPAANLGQNANHKSTVTNHRTAQAALAADQEFTGARPTAPDNPDQNQDANITPGAK